MTGTYFSPHKPTKSNVDNNLGQIRMEQQSPLHLKDEAVQKPKRAIFPSLKFIGRGRKKISISSVLDCSLVEFYR